jgi:flagellar biosynthesis/type III secretory pathway chaperone
VLDLCQLLRALNALLENEYQALTSQDIGRFEGLQAEKELLLERITAINIDEVASSLESATGKSRASALGQLQAAWDSMKALGSSGNILQKRNEILINRKLGVVRDALRSLQLEGNNKTPAYYDLRGRLTDKP